MDMYSVTSENFLASSSLQGGCEAWGRLRTEREDVCEALLAEAGATRALSTDGQESDRPLEDMTRDLEWHRREALQARLRQIDDALDRVMASSYGRCSNCGKAIDEKRLSVDAAVALCLDCQTIAEGETKFRTL
jgi:DnaK suppressor protein